MSFINLNLEDVQERKPVPTGRYDLIIEDVKIREKNGVETGRSVIVGFPDHPLAQNVNHILSFPLSDDDKDKVYNKAIMMKRFLAAFKIPFTSEGFDESDFIGASANLEVALTSYDDKDTGQPVIINRINLPRLSDEA
jgi:hypothetical protein